MHVQLSEGKGPGDEARIQLQCWGLYVALKPLVNLSEGEGPGDEARIQVQCWGLYVALKSLVNLCNVTVLLYWLLFTFLLLCYYVNSLICVVFLFVRLVIY